MSESHAQTSISDALGSLTAPLDQLFGLGGGLGTSDFIADTSMPTFDVQTPNDASSRLTDSPPEQALSELPSLFRSLPFLINGIESRSEHQFFYHFTEVTSRVLTLSTDQNNPILSVILPRSLQDPMVMKSVLCLGASHFTKHLPLDASEMAMFSQDKRRLLHQAEQQQAWRNESLERLSQRQGDQTTEVEAVLISALLLILYEISEGNGSDSWNLRLTRARDVVHHALKRERQSDNDTDMDLEARDRNNHYSLLQSMKDLNINNFLLEFFIYHDVLANVTVNIPLEMPTPMYDVEPLKAQYSSQTNGTEDNQAPYVLGVNDGLLDLISRVAALRSHAMADTSLSATTISQAVGIWHDLENWCPPESMLLSEDLMYTYDAYRTALFVWLFSIIYPDNMIDERVQMMVQRGIKSLACIKPSSGSYTFLLFPLLVYGVVSIRQEDRDSVDKQFQRVEGFSRLGNIRLCQNVVHKTWESYDAGQKRSWDWVSSMQSEGVSFPIT